MSTKPTGLAAFTNKKSAVVSSEGSQPQPQPQATSASRKRAQGETVALTTRLSRADWARLRQLADAEGITLQTLVVMGLSKVFADHGLPPITP